MTSGPTSPAISRSTIRPLGRRKPADIKIGANDYLLAIAAFAAAVAAVLIVHSILHRPTGIGHRVSIWPVVVACLSSGVVAASVTLIGRLVKDRATALVAGLLAATSLAGALGSLQSEAGAVAAALVCLAVLAQVRGQVLVAVVFATLAGAARADAALLGPALAITAIISRQKNAPIGIAAAILGIFLLIAAHFDTRSPLELAHNAHWTNWFPIAAAVGCLAWFLVPFLTELSDRASRTKWAPCLVTVVVVGASILFTNRPPLAAVVPLYPVVWVVLSAGMTRLTPSAVGDLPTTTGRYLATSLGVFLVLAWRMLAEYSTFIR